MTIKIEIPSDPEYKTLAAHIGRALYQYGSGADVNGVVLDKTEETKVTPPEAESVFANKGDSEENMKADVATDQYEQLAADASQAANEDDGALPTSDAEGLPHDKRINSDPATINADGTWKARRKPKEMTKDEWVTYIDGVKAELRQALSGEPIVEDEPAIEIEQITEAEVQAGNIAPPVTDEPQQDVVEPPVAQEETVAPPVTNADELPPRTFAELMKLITSNREKVTIDDINAMIKEHGVASLPLLNSARPDLIPVVYAQIEQKVNTNG